MCGSMIRHKDRVTRVAHHYFFQPGSTMRRSPLLPFTRRHPGNRHRLAAALAAERAAGRVRDWDHRTPAPFPAIRTLLFPGY
jgi:hypothetical protein